MRPTVRRRPTRNGMLAEWAFQRAKKWEANIRASLLAYASKSSQRTEKLWSATRLGPSPICNSDTHLLTAMMSDTRTLWCLIEGDTTTFGVTAPVTTSIHLLKKLVLEECKNGVLRNVDARDLVLWKVCMLSRSCQRCGSRVLTAQESNSC